MKLQTLQVGAGDEKENVTNIMPWDLKLVCFWANSFSNLVQIWYAHSLFRHRYFLLYIEELSKAWQYQQFLERKNFFNNMSVPKHKLLFIHQNQPWIFGTINLCVTVHLTQTLLSLVYMYMSNIFAKDFPRERLRQYSHKVYFSWYEQCKPKG